MRDENFKKTWDAKPIRESIVSEPEPSVTIACPVCGGRLFEIRGKLQCTRCHTICETCCEGGRG